MIDINFYSPNNGTVKSVNGKTGTVILTALDVGAATEKYVRDRIAEAQFGGGADVDLTDYYTKEEVDALIPDVEDIDLTDYYTKSQVDAAIDAVELTPGPQGAPGQDGYTPVKGTDYWTEADKAEMVADVIAELPESGGGSGLPEVTADDNGKFLRVVEGAWAAAVVPNGEEMYF